MIIDLGFYKDSAIGYHCFFAESTLFSRVTSLGTVNKYEPCSVSGAIFWAALDVLTSL